MVVLSNSILKLREVKCAADDITPRLSSETTKSSEVARRLIQTLMAPPAEPHVSGLVIQASVWIPRSTHWLLVRLNVTALLI